ncbi:MAG TPA: aminotransferase class I/II-fold pyridoxal phosphate-dependent enzyme [Acidobacteriota bacterium]|nr:aminotransferase class I/II-fold pyridoxal phosphate-dependent enzyme [Acidobacteriota bacterium]
MKIEQFEMERTQSLYEHAVDYNLAESGVSPLSVNDLVSAETLAELAAMPLCYPEGMGSELLRERIALFYDNATADNIVVTNGGSEANYIALQALLEPGDRVACMIPNYLQTWGLARAYSERTDAFHLVESRGGDSARWALDLDSLAAAVSPATGMITVTNPNNPSGAVLDEAELEALVEAARRADAWLVFDEIYRGTELEGGTCPSIWDRYDKAIVTSGLSKAFAMPGLRIGWTVAPEPATQQMMRYRDYTTLTPNLLADRLARIAMEPTKRDEILDRSKSIVRSQLPRLVEWVDSHEELSMIPPAAAAIGMIAYDLPIESGELCEKLRTERSVLITPGSHFGVGDYFRVGYGYDIDKTCRGLALISEAIAQLLPVIATP